LLKRLNQKFSKPFDEHDQSLLGPGLENRNEQIRKIIAGLTDQKKIWLNRESSFTHGVA